jgi:MFS transporter, AAHS family, 4-hydroxybenzoate transporter
MRTIERRGPVDISEIIEKQRLTPFVVRLVLVSTLVTFFDGFDMNVISLVAPEVSAALHLDKFMMGNVFSAGLAGTMAGAFLFGYLGDRIGRRPSILLATLSFGVLTLGLASAGSYREMVALRLIQGIGVGGLLPLVWALNIDYAPRGYRSTVVTLLMLGYGLGDSFAGPLSIWFAPFGWQSVFIFGGCAALAASVLLIFLLPESIRYLANQRKRPDLMARFARRLAPGREIEASDRFFVSDESGSNREGFRVSALFRGELRWITPLLWTVYIAASTAIFLRVSWGPTILQAIGFSRATAAYATSISSLGGALGGLLLMRFTDTRGAISIAVFPVLTVPLLLIMGLTTIGGTPFLVMYFFLTMLIVGAHFGLHSIAGIFYPSCFRANGAGWASSVAKIGSITGPVIVASVLSTRLPVRTLFLLFAVFPFIVGVGVFILGLFQQHRLPLGAARKGDERRRLASFGEASLRTLSSIRG